MASEWGLTDRPNVTDWQGQFDRIVNREPARGN